MKDHSHFTSSSTNDLLFFCKDTHPGFKKKSGEGHNETQSSKFHLCQERKKAKSLSITTVGYNGVDFFRSSIKLLGPAGI